MTSQQILQSDFLDILFDNRNKEYGAYNLRRHYNAQMTKSLVAGILLSAVCVFSPRLFSTQSIEVAEDNDYSIRTAVIPPIAPKIEPPKITPPKTPKFKSQDFLTLKVVDKEVPPLATQTDLTHSLISDAKEDGLDVPAVITPPVTADHSTGPAPEKQEPPKEVKPDRQPQFPGGMQAWAAFLNNNLHAPQDLESGEKRVVNIRFHVDADGTITNFQIIQSGGTAFDNEVIRVLKRMPKWMPAMQAGQPVAVSFTQPVTFVGQEE